MVSKQCWHAAVCNEVGNGEGAVRWKCETRGEPSKCDCENAATSVSKAKRIVHTSCTATARVGSGCKAFKPSNETSTTLGSENWLQPLGPATGKNGCKIHLRRATSVHEQGVYTVCVCL